MKTIVVNNQKLKPSQADILGVGGEATVFRVKDAAIKIFHKPTIARTEKLQDFLKLGKLPKAICAPVALAYDSTGRKVIGFMMRRLSPQFTVVQKLSSKKHRKTHPSLTSAVITDILLNGYDTTLELHKLGIVIGDNNDLNAAFWHSKMAFMDADSFQFGNYPCMVGTENFLDPDLYDVPLGTKPYFKPAHDWYSWFVMYIRSILMVHPYGGVHNKFPAIPQRAKAKITFLDPAVKYPKAGFHPDLLDESLMKLFERMFHNGERFIPPRNIFIEYRDSLTPCISCGAMYPSEKSSCPQCAKTNTQQVQRQIKVVKKPGKRTVNVEKIISTSGQIVWKHLCGRTVYVIAVEKMELVLYVYNPNTTIKTMPLMSLCGSPKFDFFGGKYLVYNDGTSNNLTIFDVSGYEVVEIKHNPTVDSFQGERVFACSKDHLVLVSQGYLYRSHFDLKYDRFIDENVFSVSNNQTWIAASSHSSLFFGCQRFFDSMKFFNYEFDKNKLWSPTIELKDNESIIDVNTAFTTSAILLLIKTEIKGKTYVHSFIVRQDIVLHHSRVEAMSSDLYKNIHGKSFGISGSTIIILHPTDEGIIQETIQDGSTKAVLLSETEQFVAESDSADQYLKGILVTGDQIVNYLTI